MLNYSQATWNLKKTSHYFILHLTDIKCSNFYAILPRNVGVVTNFVPKNDVLRKSLLKFCLPIHFIYARFTNFLLKAK